MRKSTLQRVLAMVLTICMVMGIFVGTVSAAEEEAAEFSASATSSVTVTSNGHYPVEFQLMNPTAKSYSVTLHQTSGDAKLNYRGTSADNGAVTVSAQNACLVSGYLTFDNAKGQANKDVTVEIRSGSTVLGTVTIDVVNGNVAAPGAPNAIRALSFNFDDTVQNWVNGSRSSKTLKITSGKEAYYGNKLELVSGHLYRLTFDVRGASNAKAVVKVKDYDGSGNALSVPVSLNNRVALTTSMVSHELRFVANTTDISDYASSELVFQAAGGTVWVDNIVLVDCGAAASNQVNNPGFEEGAKHHQWDVTAYLEDGSVYGFAPFEGEQCMSFVKADTTPFTPWAVYTESEEVTLSFWSKYYAKDTSALPTTLQAKVMAYEYDSSLKKIRERTIATFDLNDIAWESYQANYKKSADADSFRFAVQVISNVAWFRGTCFDHFYLGSTQAAADLTDAQIASAAPIAEIKSVPALPSMAEPVSYRFYNGTVTPVHGSLNIQNAEVAYDNGYEIALFSMKKPADLPADANPTVTYNGTTTAYVDGMTYKVSPKTTSGVYTFNWTDKSSQKVYFSLAGTALLVSSAESLSAAMKLGLPMKLTADTVISGKMDVTGVNCGSYKLILSADSVVTGASMADLLPPNGYKLVEKDGVITTEKIVEGQMFSAGRSLSLEGKIYINQYVAVNGFKDIDISENGGLLIWKTPVSEDEATYENAEIIKEGLFYTNGMYGQQTDGIAVKEYADELYLRAYIRGNYGEYYYSPLMEYSVQDYCESRLDNSKNEDMKNLAAAMLHYGASAQLYFQYNTKDLANAAIAKAWPAYGWTDHLLTKPEKVYSSMTGTGDVKVAGKSLSLDDAIAINYYFEPKGSWKAAEAELLVWDGVIAKLTADNVSYTVAMEEDGARWTGSSKEFAAKEMSKTIFACGKLTDTEGNVHYSDIIAYSPEAYAEGRIINSTNAQMVDLAKKMVIYGEFAATYFGVSNSHVKPEPPAVEPPVEEEEEEKPVVDAPAINTPEDVAYGEYLVYEGNAQAHIMLPENATELEVYAAEELQLHTELVTGAKLPINYVDPTNRVFEAYAEPAVVVAPAKGYFPVDITLKNPTDQLLELTLRQKADAEENEPKLALRGDKGLDGKITLDPYAQLVVHGQFTVEDANDYGYCAVEVEVLSGETVIATVPVGFSGRGNLVPNGDFEGGQTGWTGSVDANVARSGSASLQVAAAGVSETAEPLQLSSGQLYYMSFWAKADYMDAEIRASIADFDASNNALSTPMSMNTRADVRKGSWTFCEFYFVANTTADAAYAVSQMQLINDGDGNIWIDDLMLLTTGSYPVNETVNGDCETYYPNDTQHFKPWYTYESGYAEYEDVYEGKVAMGLKNMGLRLGYGLHPIKNAGGIYAFSFWAKAKKDGTKVPFDFSHVVAGIAGYSTTSRTVTLSDQWERYVILLETPVLEEGIKYNGFYTNFVIDDMIIDHVQVQDVTAAVALRDELDLGKIGAEQTYESGFETGADGWNAAVDTSAGHDSKSALKIAGSKTASLDQSMTLHAGYLYRLGFWAKADSADAVLFAKVSDFDGSGNALKTPMTVNTRTNLTADWQYYEYRFTANVSGDILYSYSKLALEAAGSGNIWIDDISLVGCGVAPENIMVNGDFETFYPNGDPNRTSNQIYYKFAPWFLFVCDKVEKQDVYTGAQSVRLMSAYAGNNLAAPFRTPTEMVPGKTYTMSFWAKRAAGTDYAEIQFFWNPYVNGINVQEENQTWNFKLSDQWERYEMQITVTETGGTAYNGSYMDFRYYFGEVLLDQVILMETEIANDLVIGDEDEGAAAPETEMPKQPELLPPTTNGLTIFIATEETYPALAKNFGEDLDWIGETDGFAIRQRGGTIYIFGTEPRGALNGVYDFIEENLGVLWFRANDTAYDPMKTVKPAVVDYHEKSPFSVRGWHQCGSGASGEEHDDWATDVMFSRNKLNTRTGEFVNEDRWDDWTTIGLDPYFLGHNVAWWITESPIYDPNEVEYWNTDENGRHLTVEEGATDPITYQVNFYSQKSIDATVASVRKFADNHPDMQYIMIGLNDDRYTTTLPWSDLPFEYEHGKFVYPGDYNYDSTVYYTYMNKIAVEIAKTHPDVTLVSFAYVFGEPAPECEIEPNVQINFAPLHENLREPYFTTKEDPNNPIYQNMLNWKTKTDNIVFYNYYGSSLALRWFERPIAYRIQQDMQYYAEQGFTGCTPEGQTDFGLTSEEWAMNQMTYWIYSKLVWNPYEDVDALKEYFCYKVFGEKAGPYMLEYYDYMQRAWDENEGIIHVTTMTSEYLNMFILNSGYVLEMNEALENAWKAAEGVYKDRMQYIRDTFNGVVMASSTLKIEEGSAVYTTAGKDVVLNAFDLNGEIWKDTQVLKNFYDNSRMKPVEGASTSARLLWDEDYFYVAYEMYDDSIDDIKSSTQLDAAGGWWNGKSDDVETFITVDPTRESYYFFASNPSDLSFRYRFENGYRRHVPGSDGWEFKTYFFNEEGTENDKWIVIQAISWDILGLDGKADKDTEVFAYFYHEHYSTPAADMQSISWNGATVWTAKHMRPIELRTEPYVAPEDTEAPDVDITPPENYIPQ